MKFLSLLVSLLITCSLLPAQTQSPRDDRSSGNPLDQMIWSDLTNRSRSFGQPSIDYDGSPYFLDDWRLASLQTIDNANYLEVSIKFDIYNKRLIFKDKITGDSIVLIDEFIREFVLNDKDSIYHFTKINTTKNKSYKPFSFYLVLYNGAHQLLLKPEKRFISESTSSGLANSSGTMRDEYKDLYSYYIYSKKERKLKRIKPNTKTVLKALDRNQSLVEAYIKENDLDLERNEDLIKTIAYFNTL